MKAWVLNRVGDISLQEMEAPVPAEHEVLVRVLAAGICGSDIPRIYETGAHRMPLIPGHEFSGVVEKAGKEVSPEWIGRRVAVFPKIACGRCRQCRTGHEDLCTDYDYVGSRRDGAFAEFVTAPVKNLLELPDCVSSEEAAMLEPMAVAANAVRTGIKGLQALDVPVAVCGLGSIGLMTVMFLLEAGYENVYAIGRRDYQKGKICSLGLAEKRYCDSGREDAAAWLKEVSGGGVQLFIECVGSNESIRYGIDGAVPKGRVILVGNPASDMRFERDIWWKILRGQLELRGIWNSSFRQTESVSEEEQDDWHYVLQRFSGGKTKSETLISHRFPIEELGCGFSLMKDKTEEYTKVMMISTRLPYPSDSG